MSFNGETIMHILEGLTPEERAYPVVFEDSEHPDVSYSIDQVTVTKQGWIFLKSDK